MKAENFMDIISDTTARDIEKWARSTLPVYEFMDLKILSCSDGTYSCRVALGENTGNHVGTIHAAFQWAETGRYDFELDSTIRGSDGALVAKATGCFAVRIMDREPTSEEVKPSLENPV